MAADAVIFVCVFGSSDISRPSRRSLTNLCTRREEVRFLESVSVFEDEIALKRL